MLAGRDDAVWMDKRYVVSSMTFRDSDVPCGVDRSSPVVFLTSRVNTTLLSPSPCVPTRRVSTSYLLV